MYLFDRCVYCAQPESPVLFDWKCMGRQLRPRHATVDDIRSWQTKENRLAYVTKRPNVRYQPQTKI